MYSSLPSFVLGFHGTNISVVEAVVQQRKNLQESTNAYDWLGGGIYFWENNPRRALEFAKLLKERPHPHIKWPIKEPAVLGAVIDLGHCLNLLDAQAIELVKQANELYVNNAMEAGKPLAENKKPSGSNDFLLRYRDCAVLETLHAYQKAQGNPAFDSVRGMFTEGKPLYEGAGFHESSHIQICVRNPNCIKGYFLLREPDGLWPIP